MTKRNITLSLSRQTIRKAKVLAPVVAIYKRTSGRKIEILVGEEEAYERAQRQANALLDQGFHLGGMIRALRHDWHER